jgi:hypothetical protein
VFNVPLLLAIEANTELEVGTEQKVVLIQRGDEQWCVEPHSEQRL